MQYEGGGIKIFASSGLHGAKEVAEAHARIVSAHIKSQVTL